MALLGFITIAAVLFFIMTKRLSTLIALMVIPVIAAIVGGAGAKVGTFITNGIKSISPTAAMFIFAVLFFGVLTDAGMFDPIIKGILGMVGRGPVRIAVATAVLAMIVHLDGSGVVTFSVVTPAMLPLFEALNMDRRVLATVMALGAGTMNMVPWGGPTIRAATAMNVPVSQVFNPMILPVIVGIAAVILIASYLGRREAARLGISAAAGGAGGAFEQQLTEEQKKLRRPKLFWFNVILTVVALGAMISAWQTPTVVFMLAFAIAIVVNYPNPKDQGARINAHAKSALLMATVLFAAGVFTGIMKEAGMLEAMATTLAGIIPTNLGRFLPLIIGIFAMPLSLLFDPDSYYFGVMPVLATAAAAFGVSNLAVAQASIVGQMTLGFPISPLTPATLLLAGLAGIDLGDHQKHTFIWSWLVSLVILVVAVLFRVIPI